MLENALQVYSSQIPPWARPGQPLGFHVDFFATRSSDDLVEEVFLASFSRFFTLLNRLATAADFLLLLALFYCSSNREFS
jgi:hypothetical protein